VFSVRSESILLVYFRRHSSFEVGGDSSVGIATGHGLDGPGIESRWGRDFPPIVLTSGSLSLLEPSGPVQACNGIALPLPLPLCR